METLKIYFNKIKNKYPHAKRGDICSMYTFIYFEDAPIIISEMMFITLS